MKISYKFCVVRATVELLERETPEFIPPLLSLLNSPDLNLVDYSVWGILQEKVYRTRLISTTLSTA